MRKMPRLGAIAPKWQSSWERDMVDLEPLHHRGIALLCGWLVQGMDYVTQGLGRNVKGLGLM